MQSSIVLQFVLMQVYAEVQTGFGSKYGVVENINVGVFVLWCDDSTEYEE